MENSEIEDIIPYNLLSKAIEKLLWNDDDLEYEDIKSKDAPILPQIEKFAKSNGIKLENGWKVELAQSAKLRLLKSTDIIDDKYVQMWVSLFNRFIHGK